jgi:tight adherence protein B
MLLFLAFTGMLLITFGVVAFVLRPSAEQKGVDRRIAVIKASGPGSMLGGNELDQLLKATQTSNFGWLDKLLHSFSFSQKTQLLILQADSKTSVGTLGFTCLGAAVVATGVSYLFFPILAVDGLAGLVAAYLPVAFLMVRRSRRIAAFNAALPDSVDMMSRALRAGHSLVASLSIIAEQAAEPAKTEFGEVFKKQNFGLPLRDALMELLERVPSQDLRVLVTAMLVQKDTGGNLAEILDRTVFVIRERLRIQGEIRTHTAQGRLTGWILCLLPIVMMFIINILNPGYSKIMLEDPMGQKLLYAGVVMLILGGLMIRNIINGIEV